MLKRLLLLLMVSVWLVGCNLPNSRESDTEEALDLASPAVTELSATETPTATAFPTRDQVVPTSRNAPTSLPQPGATVTTLPGAEIISADSGLVIPPVEQITFDAYLQGEGVAGLYSEGGLRGDGVNILGVQITHFAQNPANTTQFSVIDSAGMLYVSGLNGTSAYRVEQGPYTQFPAPSRAENNAAADLSVWSPDGRYLAFIVNAEQQASDGVWYFEPGQYGPIQQIVDCPFEGARSCMIVGFSDQVRFWKSREVYWSPDSTTLLISAELPAHGRRGLLIQTVTRAERVRDQRPSFVMVDYGTWGADGRILASGRNANGVYTVDWINKDGSFSQTVFAAGQNGLWMGWAVQQPGGSLVALGRPGNPDGPVAIYDMQGNSLTQAIGSTFPTRVEWNKARTYVLVEAGGRRYVAGTNGSVTDITDATAGRPVNWVEA